MTEAFYVEIEHRETPDAEEVEHIRINKSSATSSEAAEIAQNFLKEGTQFRIVKEFLDRNSCFAQPVASGQIGASED